VEEEKSQQHVVEEQTKQVSAPKLVEEELHQPMSNGEEFLQELFKEGFVCRIIPQHLKSRTKTMMECKGKTPIKEHVEKPIKNKIMSKVKESHKVQLFLGWYH
jgi:hypothetical protein